jgi:hypothetical protein
MSTPEQPATDQAPQPIELTDVERHVLAILRGARQPMDVIALASAALLDVDEALKIVDGLKKKGVVDVGPPEPIRERLEVDEDALQRVAS